MKPQPLIDDHQWLARVLHNASQESHLQALEEKDAEIHALRRTIKAILVSIGQDESGKIESETITLLDHDYAVADDREILTAMDTSPTGKRTFSIFLKKRI